VSILGKKDLPLERSRRQSRGVNKHLTCISLSLSDAGAGSGLPTLPCLALLSYITSIPMEQALLFHSSHLGQWLYRNAFPDQRIVGYDSDLISDIWTTAELSQQVSKK
jgi:hypothetical protein